MKQITKFFALSVVMIAFASSAFGQVTATANASATIVTPIAITKNVDLDFGNLAISPTVPGNIVLATDGTPTANGGVTLMPGVTPTAARFTVTGLAAATFSISLPASIVLTSGGNTMTVNTIVSDPTPQGTLTGGTATVLVGATLVVPAAQAAGSYTNTTDLDVTVNYN